MRLLAIDTSTEALSIALLTEQGTSERGLETAREQAEQILSLIDAVWIRRSVRGEIADAVLVVNENRALAGMVTLACDGDLGSIGLIAVADAYRGRGIGRRLIVAAEAFCAERKSKWLHVVTQGANQAACALYSACGFALAEEHAVYHVWVP